MTDGRKKSLNKHESNIIKGVAVIWMLIHHLFLDMTIVDKYGSVAWFLSKEMLLNIAQYGKICVAMFVFVSAYGTTVSYKKRIAAGAERMEKSFSYIYKRMMKLMSGFWFIYLIAFICCWFTGRVGQTYGTGISAVVWAIFDFMGLASALNTPTLNATWWYMSYAIFLVIYIPLINRLYDKEGGIGITALSLLLPALLGLGEGYTIRWYAVTVAVGVWIAMNGCLDRLKMRINTPIKAIVGIVVCVALAIGMFYVRRSAGAYWLVDTFCAVICAVFAICVNRLKVINTVLCFLGEHSMNIFLTHTFIFYHFFEQYVYMWKYPLLITLFLLFSSLLLSVVLEWLKKILCYSRLEDKILSMIR